MQSYKKNNPILPKSVLHGFWTTMVCEKIYSSQTDKIANTYK